ncbi:hypothetical protein [Fibrella aquatica]|uniref:hypothetical protein n=1 Tax=Fibrella aquatica TaxID=3242487 RepID=UPI0035230EB0
MEAYTVGLVNPKAKQLLEDLADLNLITLMPAMVSTVKSSLSPDDREIALTRVMQGGSQTLDVEAMIAANKEERPMPLRGDE